MSLWREYPHHHANWHKFKDSCPISCFIFPTLWNGPSKWTFWSFPPLHLRPGQPIMWNLGMWEWRGQASNLPFFNRRLDHLKFYYIRKLLFTLVHNSNTSLEKNKQTDCCQYSQIMEFSRRKKGQTFFLSPHSLGLYNNNVSCLRTIFGLNLLLS